ncbi:CDP-glycerol glycerophosphotransferase family protein [Anaerovorax odorimutans]|uniref:CDP-glycerol glycerophosphotransferase family protein n=1 Tax=Anaerovorax odorimutans TaxID=109327 RepID=A0ABT1RJD7_9FIRM|nr:CDP-glycerol glycerophosphotransferase family protein [Anaerovorax odorimutans]MCQ4635269.1 CDP-glycerol glycerophosphotransferase family protein [Anaerovorax odorimutans]
MRDLIIKAGKAVLEAIYFFLKLFPQKNRITFISRQSNSPSLDIRMLESRIEQGGVSAVVLCKKLEPGLGKKLGYCFHIFKQMYYMATSKVLVLDGYCIAASLLHHRKSLAVVQMWHALGSLKKFGYSIIDQPEGSSLSIARLMRMHKNYDYIFTSSPHCIKAFSEAFRYGEDEFTVMSLPRVDALLDEERDRTKAALIYEAYPQLKTKKTILYAPTFRKGFDMSDAVNRLVDAVDYEKYNLIIKLHPLTEGQIHVSQAIWDRHFSTLDMLSVSDFVITDYSAVTFEAALKGKLLFFYAFDLDEYMRNRSFYIDYQQEMPGMIETEADKIIRMIEENGGEPARVKDFADKYIEKQSNCTKEMTDFLIGLLDE